MLTQFETKRVDFAYFTHSPKSYSFRKQTDQWDPEACRCALARLSWVLLGLCLVFFSPWGQAQSTQLNSPEAGHLQLINDDGSEQAALHLRSQVHFDISGLYADVELIQEFDNPSQDWVEGRYVLPLPPNSAVYAMTLHIGDRVIEAEIRERQEAQKLYQEAKRAGQKAALIEQERPNLFTQSVANIAPGEAVKVQLHYLQQVEYQMGEFSLRFPMTLTPRYIPGTIEASQAQDHDPDTSRQLHQGEDAKASYPDATHAASPPPAPAPSPNQKQALGQVQSQQWQSGGWASWAAPTNQVPDAHRITPYQSSVTHPIEIRATLNAGLSLHDIQSPTHSVVVKHLNETNYGIETLEPRVAMDRDFELRWRAPNGEEPQAAVFHETMDGQSYVQLMLLPPFLEQPQAMARELILVVDTSGSMAGDSIEQAKQAVLYAIQNLQPEDLINVIEFNSNFRKLFSRPQAAKPGNLQIAKRFVSNLQANGGTEMASALSAAFSMANSESHLRQVVFITDGAVGNEAQLFELIHRQLATARLFPVGIGSAPNSYFMEQAAHFGRGSHTHISDLQQVDQQMRDLLRKIASPAMINVKVAWPGSKPGPESFPQKIPDLYLGEPIMINARSDDEFRPLESIAITGEQVGRQWQRQLQLPPAKPVQLAQGNGGAKAVLPRLWAKEKITHLLQQKIRGRSEEETKADVLPLALNFQLMSPYTSFLAREREPSRPNNQALKQQAIANATAHGQSLSYPRTATPMSFKLLLGGLSMIALVLLYLQPKYLNGSERHED